VYLCVERESLSYIAMLLTIDTFYNPETIVEKVGGSFEVENDRPASSKSLKEKTSKAERRALQEAQRAAKAAAKGAYVSFVLLLIVS
jgi:hypothetical protein